MASASRLQRVRVERFCVYSPHAPNPAERLAATSDKDMKASSLSRFISDPLPDPIPPRLLKEVGVSLFGMCVCFFISLST